MNNLFLDRVDRHVEEKERRLTEFVEQQSGVKVIATELQEWTITRHPGYRLYSITPATPELSGHYTSFLEAEKAIEEYEKQKGAV